MSVTHWFVVKGPAGMGEMLLKSVHVELAPACSSDLVVETASDELWYCTAEKPRWPELVSYNSGPINPANRHQNTPRVGRCFIPLVLIYDNFRQVALVIESTKAKRDTVLSREKKMNSAGPAVAQINRSV